MQLKSQLKKRKKIGKNPTIRVTGKNHVTNSQAGYIDLSIRMVVPEKKVH